MSRRRTYTNPVWPEYFADPFVVRWEDRYVAYGTGPLVANSEFHVLPAANVVKLPDDISFEQAAAVMLKGLTVQYLLRQTYEVKAGDTILFHAAAGGVGSIACQWAKALGAKLIGTVSSAEKAALAKSLGLGKPSTTAMKTWPSGCWS